MTDPTKNSESFAEINSRGQTMRGMIHRPVDSSGSVRYPAVLLLHGFTGTSIEPHRLFVNAARALAQSGVVVARFDFIGSGHSDGGFIDVTPETEIEDALAQINWLQRQPGVDRSRLGLIGLSLGGLVAACVVAKSDVVKTLCLWAATANMGARMDERLNENPHSRKLLQERGAIDFGGTLVSREFFESANRMKPLEAVARFRGGVLIVHGTADPTVPLADATQYSSAFAACSPTLHLVEGADHTFNSVEWEQDVIETTSSWLKRNL